MGLVRKAIITGLAVCGFAATSQAPEFSQQYRQRLGGAVEELKIVTDDFDRDAAASSKSRKEALLGMRQSNDAFSRDRGISMQNTMERYENLRGQRLAMEQSGPLMRPVNVLSNPDAKIIRDTWTIFEPAIPLTLAGLLWGGIGALLLGALGWGVTRIGTRFENPEEHDYVQPRAVRSNLSAPPIQYEGPGRRSGDFSSFANDESPVGSFDGKQT